MMVSCLWLCFIASCAAKSNLLDEGTLTASSRDSHSYRASNSRLGSTGWLARYQSSDPYWIAVTFQTAKTVICVITQGHSGGWNWSAFVQSYNIRYIEIGADTKYITDRHGTPIEFEGNTDESSHKTNYLPYVIATRYLRLYVIESYGSYVGLRWELIGCSSTGG